MTTRSLFRNSPSQALVFKLKDSMSHYFSLVIDTSLVISFSLAVACVMSMNMAASLVKNQTEPFAPTRKQMSDTLTSCRALFKSCLGCLGPLTAKNSF